MKKSDSRLQMLFTGFAGLSLGFTPPASARLSLLCLPSHHVCVTCSVSPSLSVSDGVQDRGVGDMGLHREQSRGKLPWVLLVLVLGAPFTAVSFPQCHATVEATDTTATVCVCVCFFFLFFRCLMEPSSSFLWPPWWPLQWPTAPAARGTPSVSSSHCASGGSRGSLMVRLGGARGG